MSLAETDGVLLLAHKRSAVLRCIQGGTCEKKDIQEYLEVSRSTINRAVSELSDARIVEETPSGLRLSLFGALLLLVYSECAEQIEALVASKAVLGELPADGGIEMPVVRDSEVLLAEDHSPREPIRRLCKRISNSSTLRCLFPVVLPLCLKTIHERVGVRDVDAEIVFGDGVTSTLTAEYEGFTAQILDADDAAVYEASDLPQYLVCLADEEVWIAHTGVKGTLHGVLRNDTASAVRWARLEFENHVELADRIVK